MEEKKNLNEIEVMMGNSSNDKLTEANETNDDENEKLNSRRPVRTTRGKLPARYACSAIEQKLCDPSNYNEALEGDNSINWVSAMDEEIENLRENDTWELVNLPPDKTCIGCKWTYKTKYDGEGNLDKYKARLVALGYSEKYGRDFEEVYAPVVKYTTLRTLLTIAGEKCIEVRHIDIKSAVIKA